MSTTRHLMLAFLAALLLPVSATAGGWWSFAQTDRSTVAVGQRVKVEAGVMFSSAQAARRARDGQFYVYALRGLDWAAVSSAMTKAVPGDWWSLGNAEAVELAPVDLRVGDGNLGRARAVFTVPDLPVRSYALMLCDAGCARPLADVVPTRGFTVVADPATAKLAEQTRRLEERLATAQRRSAASARTAGRGASAAAATAESEVRALSKKVSALERQLGEPAGPSGPPFWTLAGWLIAGALAGALAVLMLRRRSGQPPPLAPDWGPRDDELRELITSHRSGSRK
jgi:hypothetical protein